MLEIACVINSSKEHLIGGTSALAIPATMMKHNKIIISEGASSIFVDNSSGRIIAASSTSTKKVVALRVITI